jgi:hypothetical protein
MSGRVPTGRTVLHNTTFSPVCRNPSLTPVSYPGTVDIRAGAAWSIKGLSSTPSNETPGKWRARLSRSNGRPLITGRKKLWRFVTSVDATTASAALLMALAAIDAGTFARTASPPEKYWRRGGQRSSLSARIVPQAKRGTRHSLAWAQFGRASIAEPSKK